MASVEIFFREVVREMKRVGVGSKAAALSFYAIFALAPAIIILISVGGLTIGERLAEKQLISYFEQRLGSSAVPFFENVLQAVKNTRPHLLFSFIGLTLMVYGLSHFFFALKGAFFSIFGIYLGFLRNPGRTFVNYFKSFLYTLILASLVFALILINAAVPIISAFFQG
ncbi:MAG: serum resistance locus BrkB-like protein, partial [Parcubacteria group bacterium Gr01-1014_107]